MPIRIFHQSRVTNHEIYKLKNIYLQDFNSKIKSSEIKQKNNSNRQSNKLFKKYFRKYYLYFYLFETKFLCQRKYNYLYAFRETFIRKKN